MRALSVPLSLSLARSLSHTLTDSLTLSCVQPHTLSQTLSPSLSCTHAHTHSHTYSQTLSPTLFLCSMFRVLHLTAWLLGVLLLVSICWAEEAEEDEFPAYGTTPYPDADYDYNNATFDYIFFSNSSSEDLEKFIMETAGEDVTPTDITVTMTEDTTAGYETQTEEEEVDVEEEVQQEEEKKEEQEKEEEEEERRTVTKAPTSRHFPKAAASRSASTCVLVALGLLSHLWAIL
ncbi:uncharacterized protein si:ch211-191i18.2 [Engraulis encrasicolus]|uniref:uncharacterized protein si:ch211-191i18.2 n=1 Tax=Engraulis encrasicolus TaxID=184585 RepID=UPI002FD1B860